MGLTRVLKCSKSSIVSLQNILQKFTSFSVVFFLQLQEYLVVYIWESADSLVRGPRMRQRWSGELLQQPALASVQHVHQRRSGGGGPRSRWCGGGAPRSHRYSGWHPCRKLAPAASRCSHSPSPPHLLQPPHRPCSAQNQRPLVLLLLLLLSPHGTRSLRRS